jgi:hypothetical protein
MRPEELRKEAYDLFRDNSVPVYIDIPLFQDNILIHNFRFMYQSDKKTWICSEGHGMMENIIGCVKDIKLKGRKE